MKSSRPVNKVLNDANDELAILVTRTRQLASLTRILRQQLDPAIASHCYVGRIEHNRLVVIVDSAAWATKFRFYSAALLPALKNAHHSFAKIEQIQVKILTPTGQDWTSAAAPAVTVRPSLNEENARGITTLADSIDDPELQAALNRLARHGQ